MADKNDLIIRDGDANVAQATSISTLNNIPTNQGLTINADVKNFNLYNTTKLDNSTLYTIIENSGITQTNAGTNETAIVIQWSNSNWVNTRDYYLMAQVELSVTTPTYVVDVGTPPLPTTFDLDPILINNPKYAGSIQDEFYYREDNKIAGLAYQDLKNPFETGVYKAGGLLNCFSRIEPVGGSNNQQLSRASMFAQPQLSNQGLFTRVDREEALKRGVVGMPMSNDGYDFMQINPTTIERNTTPGYSSTSNAHFRTNRGYIEGFESLIRQASFYNGATRTRSGAGTTTTYTNIVNVPIPLRMISEFCATNMTLPPEFKFRFSFYIKNNPQFLYAPNVDAIVANRNIFTARIIPASLQLQYTSMSLTNPLQEQLNIKWSQNKFAFDILTTDPYQFRNYPYFETISASYVRPFQLELYAIANSDKTIKVGNPETAVIQHYADTLSALVDAFGNEVQVQRLRFLLSGRPVLDIDLTLTSATNAFIPIGYENIINEKSRRNMQSANNAFSTELPVSGTYNSRTVGYLICIPITPNMFFDLYNYPVDQGSIQLQCQIITSAKLNENLTLYVNKRVVDTYTLDTNNKISVVTWPKRVVQTGSGTDILNKVVVPAN